MSNFDAMFLVKTQIQTLASIIADRGLIFEPIPLDDLNAMSLCELERVRKAYHELAYAPPQK